MTNPRMPSGLGPGGRMLWKSITDDHELDGPQVVQLTEACRMKDRCDKLDELLRGDVDAWATLVPADMVGVEFKLQIVGALSKANETANSMKQLIAALRLPDPATGKRPQHRGPRGAQKPTVPGGADGAGKVSSIDRARERAARKSG
ncbi:hypothetical protein GUY44_07460 [Pimelobacter simplex]|nr:hypothetical protein [Pimelobacter simplex]SFM90156.1 hypothetical protein SAMN05421671_4107 [Pimelobacter simplex]